VGGALVRIHSLKCSQQYNDKIGMLRAYNKDKARWSVSILGNNLQDFIWVRADNLAVVASGAGGGTAGATATQRRPGLHTEGGYTLTMRAGGGGEIGAVFNGNESYDEEDRYHPHPPHLETHCLQYQGGWPWMGSKAYAVHWGQGSVYADSAESGDDEEYCGIFDDEDGTDFRRSDFELSEEGSELCRKYYRNVQGLSRAKTDPCCCMRRKMHDCISEGRHLYGVYRCQHYRGRMAIGAESFLRAYLCSKSAYTCMYISYM